MGEQRQRHEDNNKSLFAVNSAIIQKKRVFNFANYNDTSSLERKTNPIFLKTIKLEFDVCRAEGKVNDKGEVEVKMLVDNTSGFDWPDKLLIKGADGCELVKNVEHLIIGRVSKSNMKLVKFSFKVKDVKEIAGKEIVFNFSKIDEEQRIEFVGDEMVVKVKELEKKKCFMRSCGFFV